MIMERPETNSLRDKEEREGGIKSCDQMEVNQERGKEKARGGRKEKDT